MPKFMQIVEYKTSQPEEMQRLSDKMQTERGGDRKGGPTQVMVGQDRDQAGTYRTVITFKSYEEAMANSNREDTSDFAQRMAELCDGPPTFYNMDVIDEM